MLGFRQCRTRSIICSRSSIGRKETIMPQQRSSLQCRHKFGLALFTIWFHIIAVSVAAGEGADEWQTLAADTKPVVLWKLAAADGDADWAAFYQYAEAGGKFDRKGRVVQ